MARNRVIFTNKNIFKKILKKVLTNNKIRATMVKLSTRDGTYKSNKINLF